VGCVQSTGFDNEAKARKSHCRLLSLPRLLVAFKFCAVGGEGHLDRTLYLFHVHIRVEGHHLPSLSSTLGNDEIESQLKRDRLMAKNKIKMLLLGAGESGKVCQSNMQPNRCELNASLLQSTVLKQMKLIHQGGYNDSERDSYQGDHFLQHHPIYAVHPYSTLT
jgi:hypothetical protein